MGVPCARAASRRVGESASEGGSAEWRSSCSDDSSSDCVRNGRVLVCCEWQSIPSLRPSVFSHVSPTIDQRCNVPMFIAGPRVVIHRWGEEDHARPSYRCTRGPPALKRLCRQVRVSVCVPGNPTLDGHPDSSDDDIRHSSIQMYRQRVCPRSSELSMCVSPYVYRGSYYPTLSSLGGYGGAGHTEDVWRSDRVALSTATLR